MDDQPSQPGFISLFEFDLLRSTFNRLVAEQSIAKVLWQQTARGLVLDLTGNTNPNDELIERIVAHHATVKEVRED